MGGNGYEKFKYFRQNIWPDAEQSIQDVEQAIRNEDIFDRGTGVGSVVIKRTIGPVITKLEITEENSTIVELSEIPILNDNEIKLHFEDGRYSWSINSDYESEQSYMIDNTTEDFLTVNFISDRKFLIEEYEWNYESDNIQTYYNFECIANGSVSMSIGSGTTANGNSSHAEGLITIASGDYSHAEGYGTIASGSKSHAEGLVTIAIGDNSHAEGLNTTTNGPVSHAEGYFTLANGPVSHAEGQSTTASGLGSHAEGLSTSAGADYSHVGGFNNITTTTATASQIAAGNGITLTAANTCAANQFWVAGNGNGIIMHSPNGTKYKLYVLDGGSLTAIPV